MEKMTDKLQDFMKEIAEEADTTYAHLNQILKISRFTQTHKDHVLDYVHAKISALSGRLAALCGGEAEKSLYNGDEQLDALYFVRNAIHGPTARANLLLRTYLEDLFYCMESDIREDSPLRQYPLWVYTEGARLTAEYLDEASKRENRYNKQRRKDLKKRGRR